MTEEKPLYEQDAESTAADPDSTPIGERKVFTQPYDLGVDALMRQIQEGVIFLRPLSQRPNFQRKYVWSDVLASRLIESILLNVPIPPCYLSQNEDFELDVIDGQQRLFSIYRFMDNQFPLRGLEVLKDLNDSRFFMLPARLQRQMSTHTLRCVLITNESHPEIKFEVFERLNSNTAPLNAQELRNCVYRGALNELLQEVVTNPRWLDILRKRSPDKRMRDEELALRFFAFQLEGKASYRTPLKLWLNSAAKAGRTLNTAKIDSLRCTWNDALKASLEWFTPLECFRRAPFGDFKAVNRAVFDLVMNMAASMDVRQASSIRNEVRKRYVQLCRDGEFSDLISRAVDHKKRTDRRFEIWDERFSDLIS